MKHLRLFSLLALSVLLTGCYTRIYTVAPTTDYVAPVKTVYTTHVTTPAPKHTTSQTVTVTSYNTDLSFYLDLQAVAAAFAESHSAKEFEQLLNSSRYMINNLDLNRDGFVDYLRVIETRQGYYYAYLIQACLAPNVFQDVATLIAERRASTLYVEIVGDPYLYGYNYIVRPTFVHRPPLWDIFAHPNYTVWISPYYYGYWPSYYSRPKPVYLSHYQAYVRTYMSHHHYCHVCDYPIHCFYDGYTHMTKPHRRNDYHHKHPEYAFDRRVSANGSGVSIRNAGQLRTQTTGDRNTSTNTQSGVTNRKPTTTTTTTTRKPATTTTTTTTTRKPTTTKATTSTVTTRKPTTTTTRKPATTTTTTRKPTTTKSTSSAATTRKSTSVQTTVESRVSKSGTTRTTITQKDASGKKTVVNRSTNAPSRQQKTTSSAPTRNQRTSTSTQSGRTSR